MTEYVHGDHPPGKDVVRLDIYDPAGNSSVRDSRNLTLEEGLFEDVLQIPYNTPPGTWKLIAMHVISGLRMEAKLALYPSQ